MTSQRTRDRLVERLAAEGVTDRRVLDAMAAVPRHIFVDEALASRAYEDSALPIGFGQTISQPQTVARMTEVLISQGIPSRCLEIGSGCGYQTAILARLCHRVYSVERVRSLVFSARERLHLLQISNVRVRHGDGFQGWAEHGPYDGVLVAAASARVPVALVEQMALGGRMVVPVDSASGQRLMLIRRTETGVEEQVLESVSFVPMLEGLA